MPWYYWLSLIFLAFLCVGIFLSCKYNNPYKWIHIVGFPGSGKTTLSVKLAQQHIKKGWKVYSNIEIPGSYLIDPKDLGVYHMDQKAVIILDEIGLVWDNRDFKAFDKTSRDWAKKHRHAMHKVYSFSQAMDYDLKLRVVTDKLYLLINYFGWLSVAKEIKMKWVAVQPDTNSEGRIAQAMVLQPFILAPFGARIYTFIPRWIKYFDSFEWAQLPNKEYRPIQYPANIKKRFIPKVLRNSEFVFIGDSSAAAARTSRTFKLKDVLSRRIFKKNESLLDSPLESGRTERSEENPDSKGIGPNLISGASELDLTSLFNIQESEEQEGRRP